MAAKAAIREAAGAADTIDDAREEPVHDGEGEFLSRADSSLTRMLNVLGLFSSSTPTLTVEQIAERVGVPKSTGYRYVQELCRTGLLARLDRSITLGPRIIELDRSIRESDPVLRAAIAPMRELADQTGLDVFISKLYGHSIITVHMETAGDPVAQRPYSYGRGRPMPPLRGASSKAIVAFLPAARLRRLYEDVVAEARNVPPWPLFHEDAQAVRRAGHCRTSGELNDGVTGVAAPVFGRGRHVVASVTAVGDASRVELFNPDALAELVGRAARTVSARLSDDAHL